MESYVYINLNGKFIPAGKLLTEGNGRDATAYFAYGREYLQKKNAVPIDPIELPLVTKQFVTQTSFEMFNGIRDAGPDRWGRYLLDKLFNRTLSEHEYLLATGKDRVGALAFGPDLNGPKMLTPDGYKQYKENQIDLTICQVATEDAVNNVDSEELKSLLQYGPSLGGARPKAAVKWKNQDYIAKFSTSLDSRNEPLIEFATMSLAKKAGLNVPDIELVKVSKRDVFLIKRFDRKGKNQLPIPFISGLTATNSHESDYASWSYRALAETLIRFSPEPEEDLLELYKRLVFNVLVNNDDDHLRNHGLLHKEKNLWGLSPLYDVVPRDQATQTFRLALQVGEYGKEASKKNVLSAARYFRLEPKRAVDIWLQLTDFVESNWRKQFRQSGFDKNALTRFENSIGAK